MDAFMPGFHSCNVKLFYPEPDQPLSMRSEKRNKLQYTKGTFFKNEGKKLLTLSDAIISQAHLAAMFPTSPGVSLY